MGSKSTHFYFRPGTVIFTLNRDFVFEQIDIPINTICNTCQLNIKETLASINAKEFLGGMTKSLEDNAIYAINLEDEPFVAFVRLCMNKCCGEIIKWLKKSYCPQYYFHYDEQLEKKILSNWKRAGTDVKTATSPMARLHFARIMNDYVTLLTVLFPDNLYSSKSKITFPGSKCAIIKSKNRDAKLKQFKVDLNFVDVLQSFTEVSQFETIKLSCNEMNSKIESNKKINQWLLQENGSILRSNKRYKYSFPITKHFLTDLDLTKQVIVDDDQENFINMYHLVNKNELLTILEKQYRFNHTKTILNWIKSKVEDKKFTFTPNIWNYVIQENILTNDVEGLLNVFQYRTNEINHSLIFMRMHLTYKSAATFLRCNDEMSKILERISNSESNQCGIRNPPTYVKYDKNGWQTTDIYPHIKTDKYGYYWLLESQFITLIQTIYNDIPKQLFLPQFKYKDFASMIQSMDFHKLKSIIFELSTNMVVPSNREKMFFVAGFTNIKFIYAFASRFVNQKIESSEVEAFISGMDHRYSIGENPNSERKYIYHYNSLFEKSGKKFIDYLWLLIIKHGKTNLSVYKLLHSVKQIYAIIEKGAPQEMNQYALGDQILDKFE